MLFPSALGHRIKLDGLHDLALAIVDGLLEAEPTVPIGLIAGGAILIKCHLNDALLYGLSVKEAGIGYEWDLLGLEVYSP